VPPLELYVFTHRHGLAARLGHDLRLSTRAARLSLSDGQLEVRVPLQSLEVDGAMRRGQLDRTALNDADRKTILRAMRDEVLQVGRHPEALLRGAVRVEGDRVTVRGQLSLGGQTCPLDLELGRRGEQLVGEVALQPSRWGIRPYSGMGGVLKVTDAVEVRVELQLEAGQEWPPATLG
jgi:hypothetical protein